MALEILTVGAEVLYAVETVAGQRPSTGYKVISSVNQAPEFSMDVETIDVSNISDKITRYAEGRQDPGGDKSFTLGHTDAVIDEWEELVAAAEEGLKAGKQTWFEYRYPAPATKAFYFIGKPQALGNGGIEGNNASTIPAHVVCSGGGVWETASTGDAN